MATDYNQKSILNPKTTRYTWSITDFGNYLDFIDEHESLTMSSEQFKVNDLDHLLFSLQITVFSRSIICYLCRSPNTKYNKLIGEIYLEKNNKVWEKKHFKVDYTTYVDNSSEKLIKLEFNPNVLLSSQIHFNGNLDVVCYLRVLDVDVKIHPIYTPKPYQSIKDDIKQLLETKNNSDVVFEVHGKEFAAHKSILSARSPMFAAMLEDNTVKETPNRIKMVDISTSTFDLLLHFIYTDEIKTPLDLGTGINLLHAACKYHLDGLQNQCTEQLFKLITIDNAEDLRKIAEDYNFIDFLNSIEGFIKSHQKPA